MESPDFQQRMKAHREAWERVLPWVQGARTLALLEAAVSSGVIDPATAGVRMPGEANATGTLSPRTARELLATLEREGLIVATGGSGAVPFQVAPALAPLFFADAPQRLENLLGRERAITEALRAGGGDAQARAFALGSGFDPMSPWAAPAARALMAGFPELRARWEAGARHLELGCGAASFALGMLQVFARLEVVGVELDPSAAGEARSRAEQLQLGARFEVRVMDAQSFRDTAPFDSAQWSQQFFPPHARAGSLAAAFRALRPGATLVVPTFGAKTPADSVGATTQLAFQRLGVEVRFDAEVAEEVQAAGFQVLRAIPLPPGPYMWSRGVLIAQHP